MNRTVSGDVAAQGKCTKCYFGRAGSGCCRWWAVVPRGLLLLVVVYPFLLGVVRLRSAVPFPLPDEALQWGVYLTQQQQKGAATPCVLPRDWKG